MRRQPWLVFVVLTACTAAPNASDAGPGRPDVWEFYCDPDCGHGIQAYPCDPSDPNACPADRRCAFGHVTGGDRTQFYTFTCVSAGASLALGEPCTYSVHDTQTPLQYFGFAAYGPPAHFEASDCAAGLACLPTIGPASCVRACGPSAAICTPDQICMSGRLGCEVPLPCDPTAPSSCDAEHACWPRATASGDEWTCLGFGDDRLGAACARPSDCDPNSLCVAGRCALGPHGVCDPTAADAGLAPDAGPTAGECMASDCIGVALTSTGRMIGLCAR